jgi:hypothetical protein
MTRPGAFEWPEYAACDEAAAYIADMLMQIALQFEATHFAQIRRHYQSLRPEPDDNPGQQLDLFDQHKPF